MCSQVKSKVQNLFYSYRLKCCAGKREYIERHLENILIAITSPPSNIEWRASINLHRSSGESIRSTSNVQRGEKEKSDGLMER